LSDAGFGIVSQRAVQDAQTRGTDFGRAPVGTGPYRLESWEQGEQLVLARFADYYRGQAAIGVVSCRFVGDSAGGAAALEAGRIDLYRSVSIPERQKLLQNASLQHQEGAGTVLWHLSFNMNSTLFGDIRVRQATAHAIDRVHLVEEGFDGFGVPVACPMPPPAFGYQGAMEPLALNPAQSQALLAEAGFAQGVPAALRVVDTPESVKLAQLICEQLAPAGIRLSVEPMSFKEYLAQVADKCDYDIALYSIDSVILDADYACSRRLHSTLAGSGNNFSRYDSLQADALLKSAREQNDPALRDQLYAELSLLVRDEAPVLPLFAQTGVVFARNGLLGLYYHPDDKLMIYDLTW
jgi:peptide/nickel transport system substrate-binding protein